MTIDTIQTDVSQQKQENEQTGPVSRRDQMLAEIEGKVDEQREQQIAPLKPETTEPEVVVVDDTQRYKVRVKVDGEEKELLLADVVTGFQKESAADRRLREAAAERKKLEEWERNLKNRESKLETVVVPAPAAAEAEPVEVDGRLKSALDALVDGKTDAAAEVLSDLLKGRPEPALPAVVTVDETAIANRVKAELNQETEWDRFTSEYPEFAENFDDAGNVVLTRERQYGDYLFDTKYGPKVDSGDLSHQQALRDCAKEVRTFFTPPPATQEATPTENRREALKKTIDNLPVAAGARSAGPGNEPEETPSSVIADMRKARGLPV